MHCCTWALCATVHKEKVYVLRLKLTHTALVLKHAYIWTSRHFDSGDELERDWKWKFLKMKGKIFGKTGPTGQRGPPLEVDHFDRFRRTVPFTFGPKFWHNRKHP